MKPRIKRTRPAAFHSIINCMKLLSFFSLVRMIHACGCIHVYVQVHVHVNVCMCVTNTFHVFENNSKTMYTINICPILVASYCGIAARLMTTDLFTTKQKRAKKNYRVKKRSENFPLDQSPMKFIRTWVYVQIDRHTQTHTYVCICIQMHVLVHCCIGSGHRA